MKRLQNTDLYFRPERFGLSVVGEIHAQEGEGYHIFMVWKDTEARFLWANDYRGAFGPFEDCSPEHGIDRGDVVDARKALSDWESWLRGVGVGVNSKGVEKFQRRLIGHQLAL